MKQSDIEEFKAIFFVAVGVLAYTSDLRILAIALWVLASLSLLAACVHAFYEREIKKLKKLLRKEL